jgi:septal ring factor EnvC (AmiA/AmiB activator)
MMELFGAVTALKDIPWKWIGVALLVLAVGLTITFGYLHVENLRKELETKTAQLAAEHQKLELAEATTRAIRLEHDNQVERIQTLEKQRTDIAIEVTKLRTDLANLDLEQDMESDDEQKADAAIARLNAAHARLNGLLRGASGPDQLHSGKDPGSEARKAGAPGPLRRALQALRQDGVSQPR